MNQIVRLCLLAVMMLLPLAAAGDGAKSFAVRVVGEGPPMVLIPGLTNSGEVWDATAEHFKGRYQMHIVTLAGFAGQPAIPAPFMETVRDELIAYVMEQKLEKPVVMGHSLGGFMAMWIGATAPDLVGPVISVDGGAWMPALMMGDGATMEMAKAQAGAMRGMYDSMTPEMFAQQTRGFLGMMVIDPKHADEIMETAGKSDPKAVGLAMAELMTTDIRAELANVKSPLLLIGSLAMAPNDAFKELMRKNYEAQVAAAPDAKVVFTETARHFIMYDDPDFLHKTVDGFLAGE